METGFAPSGERSLAVIRDGVIAEGDPAESVSLEAKSYIDLTQRLGVAKVATQDKKHALQDGAVYVRGKSNTLPAKASELLALVSRGQVSQTPAVAVSLRCEGSAITLHDADEMFGKLTRVIAETYREERAERANRPQQPNYPGFFLPQEHYGQPNLSGPPKHVEEVLTAWKERARSGWPRTLKKIAGAVLAPLGFTVENSAASYLNNPLMIVTIDGAYGVDNEHLASIHRRTMSVMIVSYRDADLVLGRGCAAGLACR